jgi:hypothetical protein
MVFFAEDCGGDVMVYGLLLTLIMILRYPNYGYKGGWITYTIQNAAIFHSRKMLPRVGRTLSSDGSKVAPSTFLG